MTRSRTVSRAGAMALAAALALAAPAGAAERPARPGPQPAPQYRLAEPPETQPRTRARSGPGIAAAPAPRRDITSEVVARGGRLYLRGDVEAWPRGKVLVQRKACEDCRWRRHERTRTGKHGWFRSRIGAPRHGSTFWRARVGAAGGYSRSFSATWETYY